MTRKAKSKQVVHTHIKLSDGSEYIGIVGAGEGDGFTMSDTFDVTECGCLPEALATHDLDKPLGRVVFYWSHVMFTRDVMMVPVAQRFEGSGD